jgi:predicted dehydrogenase
MSTEHIRFAIIGLDHNHWQNHARILLNVGAELATYYTDKPELIAEFRQSYSNVPLAPSMQAILDDETIKVIAGSARPAERAAISIAAMRHGKDVLADKPAVINLEQLGEIERAQRETGRIWCLYSNEHHDRRCTVKAGELVAQGVIGKVVQTTGFGPHRVGSTPRPEWFFDRSISGGIIGDIGAHQIEQFLFFTNSTTAKIIHSQTANFGHPEHPDFDDYGDVLLEGDGGLGWFRVDWYTPHSMEVPGDIRLFILGTDGYMEMRKYYDPAWPGAASPKDARGRPGGQHLFVMDNKEARLVDTTDVPLTFGARFLDDVLNRTETAMSQARSFLTIRLATEAQLNARRLGFGSRPPVTAGAD